MNFKDVPCIVLENLTEAQKKAYIIADNKLAINSEWDYELLKIEMDRLIELDYNLNFTGFCSDDIEDILKNIDYSNKNKEINVDLFEDENKLVFKLSSDQYKEVMEKLTSIDKCIEKALLKVLNL